MRREEEARGSCRRKAIEMNTQRAVVIFIMLAVAFSMATSFSIFPKGFFSSIEKGLGLAHPGQRGFAYNIKPDVTNIIGIWAPDHDHRFWHDFNIYGFTSTG
ncbi:uncharacterized protein [Penaeus vannamei]|uniref:uncharacterized protein isoform X2 n=1 Tax=Penaeus vannamei TaxID=6689 RepID=UPI00387F6C28